MRLKKDARFAIRFSVKDRKALSQLAEKEDVTMTHLIRRAIRDVLSRGVEPRR